MIAGVHHVAKDDLGTRLSEITRSAPELLTCPLGAKKQDLSLARGLHAVAVPCEQCTLKLCLKR